ncbi:MAG: class I SAM-dependent methyltransferase [Acidobacteria bacterium]|nr:class I SAM-dependent methyltransferase [Acidobacteriota bacterium]
MRPGLLLPDCAWRPAGNQGRPESACAGDPMHFDQSYFESQYRDYSAQNPLRKLDFYRRLAVMASRGRQRPRILDLGCASGLFLSRLDSNWERYGVDASDYAIARARGLVPDAVFETSSSAGWTFPGPFDVITAFDVLEHIPALDETLRRVAVALRPGGGFIFVVPVYDGPTGPLIRALDRDPTHIHRKSRAYWLERTSVHFNIVSWWGIYRYLFPGGYYLHVVTRVLRRCSPAIACLAQVRGR